MLLRFATDDFMTVAQDTLAHDPARIADYVARGETWRAPAVGLDTKPTGPFKLFQPAQQRFYLVTASLACRKPGLPDHTVRASEQERVSWVLRRVRPRESGSNPPAPDAWVEDAWIPVGSAGSWRTATPTSLEGGEERLPMFSLSFRDGEMARGLRAALVPVARREQYARAATSARQPAPAAGPAPAATAIDEIGSRRARLCHRTRVEEIGDTARSGAAPVRVSVGTCRRLRLQSSPCSCGFLSLRRREVARMLLYSR
jgi:hypothetical protein